MTTFFAILYLFGRALWEIFLWLCRALAMTGAIALLWTAAYWLWRHA